MCSPHPPTDPNRGGLGAAEDSPGRSLAQPWEDEPVGRGSSPVGAIRTKPSSPLRSATRYSGQPARQTPCAPLDQRMSPRPPKCTSPYPEFWSRDLAFRLPPFHVE